jgi:hypothetical protein
MCRVYDNVAIAKIGKIPWCSDADILMLARILGFHFKGDCRSPVYMIGIRNLVYTKLCKAKMNYMSTMVGLPDSVYPLKHGRQRKSQTLH